MKKVAILGAGIAGLSVAWFLQQKYGDTIELTIYEKTGRVGGWIRSVKREGFHCECGPRGFRPTGRGITTLKLVQALGLAGDLIEASRSAQQRYIGLNGKLQRISIGFLLRQGLLGAIVKDLVTSKTLLEDESIASFAHRRFNRRIAETIWDPLAKGIFGGDYHQLSMRNSLPLVWDYEQTYGSVIKGMMSSKKNSRGKGTPSLYSFKEGMETLPKVLAEHLNIPIYLNQEINNLNDVEADIVISTLPTYALAKLVGCEDRLEYATLMTLHLCWSGSLLKHSGFGFLLPSKEKSEILGMTWDSEMFPQLNQGAQTRLTAMIKGDHCEIKALKDTQEVLRNYMGISDRPDLVWIEKAERAIPQYRLLHHQTIAHLRESLPPNIYALGCAFDGIGVNDVIASAETWVQSFCL